MWFFLTTKQASKTLEGPAPPIFSADRSQSRIVVVTRHWPQAFREVGTGPSLAALRRGDPPWLGTSPASPAAPRASEAPA
jgi:hypothetical protein